jgi:integrase
MFPYRPRSLSRCGSPLVGVESCHHKRGGTADTAPGTTKRDRDAQRIIPQLERTGTPGIFRRHTKTCDRKGRCECSYVVVWRHRGRRHTETYRTFAEAREAKGNRDAGDRRPVARVGFEDYFTGWIDSYVGRTARGFSDRSRQLYRRQLKQHALPRWRTWRLADVEPADVRELFSALRDDGASNATVKGLRAALSAMFATAVEDRLLRSNRVQGVGIPAAADGIRGEERAKALTRVELALLLAAMPAGWRLFFEFLTHTGLRISEAIGLTWTHLDLGTRRGCGCASSSTTASGTGSSRATPQRDLPLAAGMAERLRARRRDSYPDEVAPVFASSAGTELSRPNLAGRVLKPAAETVGLVVPGANGEPTAWVSFHTFRHTCASLLFDAGKNVKQVAEWLGHADPAFTLRVYVHLLDDGLGEADFFDNVVASTTLEAKLPSLTT